jgi:hypothetical protein
MSYRPITDTWLLARSKVKYYGAYPAGFLERARALLGVNINDPVLHVCGGRVRDYPYRGGVGPHDRTMDLDVNMYPDFLRDAREPFPTIPTRMKVGSGWTSELWAAVLADPPYTEADADKYAPKAGVLPTPRLLLANGLKAVRVGGKVGVLHYVAPRPPSVEKDSDKAKFVALITVFVGFENRPRLFTVYERRK